MKFCTYHVGLEVTIIPFTSCHQMIPNRSGGTTWCCDFNTTCMLCQWQEFEQTAETCCPILSRIAFIASTFHKILRCALFKMIAINHFVHLNSQQKNRRKSYIDSTYDLFIHICTKTVSMQIGKKKQITCGSKYDLRLFFCCAYLRLRL